MDKVILHVKLSADQSKVNALCQYLARTMGKEVVLQSIDKLKSPKSK